VFGRKAGFVLLWGIFSCESGWLPGLWSAHVVHCARGGWMCGSLFWDVVTGLGMQRLVERDGRASRKVAKVREEIAEYLCGT